MKQSRRPRQQLPGAFLFVSRGFTLVELIVVVSILAVIAMVAMPNLSSTDPSKLDAAAEIQAEAMRYARSEAMRRGEPIGFRQKSDNKQIRLYSLDTSTSPWELVYDIYHPVSKKLWNIKLDNHPFAAAEAMSSSRIFQGTCNKPSNVYFDAHGIARCANPETVLIERLDITLTLGNNTRIVSLDGPTGKVTIR